MAANYFTKKNYEGEIEATAGWIEEHAAEYNGGGSCTPTVSGELFAGATAKLADFQFANGLSANGTIEQLECLESNSAELGRISDQSSFGDFSNTFGQSLGVTALVEAGSPAAGDAAAYLAAQQCTGAEAGAFRSEMGASPTLCNTIAGDPNQVEVDSTAVAVQALVAAGDTVAAEAAVEWLESVSTEEEVGGKKLRFWQNTACTGSPEPSVNSTAVAAMAYSAIGQPGLGKAERWLKSQQSPEGWLEGCTDPNPEVLNSNRIRATTQAALGLLGVSYVDLASSVYAP